MGWTQVQDVNNGCFDVANCPSGSMLSCDVLSPGTYQVVDHTNQRRWQNVVVSGGSGGSSSCADNIQPCINDNSPVGDNQYTITSFNDDFSSGNINSSSAYWFRDNMHTASKSRVGSGMRDINVTISTGKGESVSLSNGDFHFSFGNYHLNNTLRSKEYGFDSLALLKGRSVQEKIDNYRARAVWSDLNRRETRISSSFRYSDTSEGAYNVKTDTPLLINGGDNSFSMGSVGIENPDGRSERIAVNVANAQSRSCVSDGFNLNFNVF